MCRHESTLGPCPFERHLAQWKKIGWQAHHPRRLLWCSGNDTSCSPGHSNLPNTTFHTLAPTRLLLQWHYYCWRPHPHPHSSTAGTTAKTPIPARANGPALPRSARARQNPPLITPPRYQKQSAAKQHRHTREAADSPLGTVKQRGKLALSKPTRPKYPDIYSSVCDNLVHAGKHGRLTRIAPVPWADPDVPDQRTARSC